MHRAHRHSLGDGHGAFHLALGNWCNLRGQDGYINMDALLGDVAYEKKLGLSQHPTSNVFLIQA